MKAIVVSGGEAPSKQLLLNEIRNSNLIIDADKGCGVLYSYNISPNYILGDFDSADKDIIKAMEVSGCEKIKYKKEKDFTDTEIAFNLAVEKGAKEIVLLRGTGTRYDHFLSNLDLMLRALKMSVILKITDDNNIIFLTDKSMILEGNKGDTMSFHAYCECVKNLNICGSKYDLINYDLCLGDGLTTSNEFIGNDIKITFDSGILMVLYTKD